MPDIKFSNQYPYTDFHELNLDWVIKEVKYWSTKVGKTIQSIELTGTVGLVDTYTINYSDGTTSTFDVTNGNGIASVAKTGTAGLVDTYTITFQDGTSTTFEVHNGTASIDDTLTLQGYAADAKATGDAIGTIGDLFEYKEQFLDADTKTSGRFYYPDSTASTSAAGYCIFPAISVSGGKTYTLVNIRTRFTNFESGGVAACLDPSDAGAANKTVTYTPATDGMLYITGGDGVNVMMFSGEYTQNDYIFGKFDYVIKTSSLGENVTESNCQFFKKCYQYLESSNATANKYWNISGGNASMGNNTGVYAYTPIKLQAGITYRFVDVFGYFCLISNDSAGTSAVRLTESTANHWNGTYTPAADCYIFMTVNSLFYEITGMLCNDEEFIPSTYTEGLYFTYFDGSTRPEVLDIHVKIDGTGDYTSVVDAVDFANSQSGSYPINIYVHSGDYDILSELGGSTFISHIEDSTDERQGLVLKRDNVNIIGVGYVVFRYELPDTVTYNQSARTSTLNLREFSNRVENITLIGKNCRYTIHDETNGGNPYIRRVMKNLRCIHKGNAAGLWPYPTVLGGGAGGGSTYDLINCQFLTSSYFIACSYHSGANQEAAMFNIDGCVGSVDDNAGTKISFRLSYHGTGKTGISVGNIKNCSGNGTCVVDPESAGDAENNIEMFVNGWETIAPIPVSGNE